MDINIAELTAHQQRLGPVVDRAQAALTAADTPVSRDAFGAFGYFLAEECATAAANGVEMLQAAHDAADEHYQKVGIWARDVDATEGEVAALFSTAPEMRNA